MFQIKVSDLIYFAWHLQIFCRTNFYFGKTYIVGIVIRLTRTKIKLSAQILAKIPLQCFIRNPISKYLRR